MSHGNVAPGRFFSSARHLCDDFFMGAASRVRVVLSVLALSSAACVSTDAPRVPERLGAAPAPADRLVSVASPPEWRPGDRWTYDLTSGNDRGTKTMEVVEVREIDKVLYYVVRFAAVDRFYTRTLKWAAVIRDAKVEAPMISPHQGFVLPLALGKR